MALQCTRIERLEKFETAEEFIRNTHNCPPVVELATILSGGQCLSFFLFVIINKEIKWSKKMVYLHSVH